MYIIVDLLTYRKVSNYEFANFSEANFYAKEYLELQDYSIMDAKSYASLRQKELHDVMATKNQPTLR